MPPDTNLKEAYLKFLTSQVGGLYDPRNKQLKLIDRSSTKEAEETSESDKQLQMLDNLLKGSVGLSIDDMVMAHELTHAAQDQHYDLATLPMNNDFNDDLAIAIKCVVEGDASIVGYSYLFGEDTVNSLIPFLSNSGVSLMGAMPLPKVPEFISQQLLFPYISGFSFVLKAKTKGGWDKVNKMFEDPPASTAQILHPEKYFEDRDYPKEIKLPDIANTLGPNYKIRLSNVIGEFSLRLLLKEFKIEREDAVANGWDGDEFEVLEKVDTIKTQSTNTTGNAKIDPNKLVLIWMTTWDSEEDAQKFLDAYQRILEKKYPDAKMQERDKATALYKYSNTDGTVSAVEEKSKDVLILESVPEDKFAKLRETLWSETTKKEIRKIERIEPKQSKKK